MPPSGYSNDQSKYITNFLRSCFTALTKEGEIENRSLEESLNKEICDINYYIKNDSPEHTVESILNLTKSFYERIYNKLLNEDSNSEINLDEILEEIKKEVLAVHIINRERITA